MSDQPCQLADFDYHLPEELIAQEPARPREAARLLDASGAGLSDHIIADLPNLLRAGDLLVVNNTSVLPAALIGQRGAGRARINLHRRLSADTWLAFAKPAKKCPPGTQITFADGFSAVVTDRADGGEVTLRFNVSGTALNACLDQHGQMPLPPYIRRPDGAGEADKHDYQTMFATHAGAVAAPTAGLHFTDGLRDRLLTAGVNFAEVTLHVGAGTFLPVKVDNIRDHKMHSEWGSLPLETVDAIHKTKASGGRVIAVGTTSLRILEAAFCHHGHLAPFTGETDIFITPGYKFGVIDMLLTNFHLPKSTLLMLVSAFSGYDFIKSAYAHAVVSGYRFFSYGDACLLACRTPRAIDKNEMRKS